MNNIIKTTESDSHYTNLEKMSVRDLLLNINKEDKTVPLAIEKIIPEIETLVKIIVEKLKSGGRLFYIGAGIIFSITIGTVLSSLFMFNNKSCTLIFSRLV